MRRETAYTFVLLDFIRDIVNSDVLLPALAFRIAVLTGVSGVCIGNKIAPIFYNTMEDSGALPLEMSVDKMHTGDVIDIYPYKGVTKNHTTGEVSVFTYISASCGFSRYISCCSTRSDALLHYYPALVKM